MATVSAAQLFYYLAWSYPILFGCFLILASVDFIRFWNARRAGWHLEYLADAAREAFAALFFGHRGIVAFNMPYREELLFGRVLALLLMLAVTFHLIATLTADARTKRRLTPPDANQEGNGTESGQAPTRSGGVSLFARGLDAWLGP